MGFARMCGSGPRRVESLLKLTIDSLLAAAALPIASFTPPKTSRGTGNPSSKLLTLIRAKSRIGYRGTKNRYGENFLLNMC